MRSKISTYLINNLINTLCKNWYTHPSRNLASKRNLLMEDAHRGQRIKGCVLTVDCSHLKTLLKMSS